MNAVAGSAFAGAVPGLVGSKNTAGAGVAAFMVDGGPDFCPQVLVFFRGLRWLGSWGPDGYAVNQALFQGAPGLVVAGVFGAHLVFGGPAVFFPAGGEDAVVFRVP